MSNSIVGTQMLRGPNSDSRKFVNPVLLAFFGLVVSAVSVVAQENSADAPSQYKWNTVSGKVVDSKGQPVAGAFVCHYRISKDNPDNHTSTNDKGEFILKYRQKKTILEKGWIWAYSPGHNLRCVSNTRTDDHLLELPEYTEFKITFTEPNGRPLRQANVQPMRYWIPNGEYSTDGQKGSLRLGGIIPKVICEKLATTTDENGQCVIRNIPRQLWGRVEIQTANHGKHILGGGTTRDSFQLAETGTLEIEILPDEPIDFSGTEVRVSGWSAAGETQLVGVINGMGICKFEHVIPGEIEIGLKIGKDQTYQPMVEKQYIVDAGGLRVVKIPIRKTVLLCGKVVADNEPVPHARLIVGGMNHVISADENGEFSTRVFPGLVRVDVYDMPRELYRDFETGKAQHVSVDSDEHQFTMDPIKLPRLSKIQIRVIDETGNPVTGYSLRSRYQRQPYGPLSGDLDKAGVVTTKLSARDLGSLDEATYYLVRQDQKEVKDVSKFVKLKIESVKPLVLSVRKDQLGTDF